MIAQDSKIGTIRIKALLNERENFELYRTLKNQTLLVVYPSLYDKWVAENLFFTVNPFKKLCFNGGTYYYVISGSKYTMDVARHGNILCSRREAVTFAYVLKQMRKVTLTPLYDGIYIEEYGYLLPTYTEEKLSDDALLGTYLSGGMAAHFSDDGLRALFLNEDALQEISDITGIARTKTATGNTEQNPPLQKNKYDTFTLPGRPELEKFFNEHIINVLNEPERYKKLGIGFPSSIILYGPPGCGKTYAVNMLAEFLNLPVYEINSASVASPYIHTTSKKISEVFDEAIKNAPSIVIIDEMESYLSTRDNYNSSTHHIEEVAEFLRRIQEAQEKRVLVIGMTNMYEKIDPAIIRRGRFDHHLEVGLPSEEEIYALLKSITENIALGDDVDLCELSKKLTGETLADIAFVIKEAGLISGKLGRDYIAMNAITEAINMLPDEDEKRKIGF